LEKQARIFAIAAHGNQKYGGGEPYVYHLDAVANLMATPTLKQAAYLHDVLEDTPITAQNLRDAGFGEDVITAVEFCSDQPGRNRRERKAATYAKAKSLKDDAREDVAIFMGFVVKLGDRVANLRECLRSCDWKGIYQMYRKEADDFRDAYRLEHGMGVVSAHLWHEYDVLVSAKNENEYLQLVETVLPLKDAIALAAQLQGDLRVTRKRLTTAEKKLTCPRCGHWFRHFSGCSCER